MFVYTSLSLLDKTHDLSLAQDTSRYYATKIF